jgi:pimeloyl-ACP methyl ester carboxylesterase
MFNMTSRSLAGMLLTLWLCLCPTIDASAAEVTAAHRESLTVERLDGSQLELLVLRPAKARVPIFLLVDGSGCTSARRAKVEALLSLQTSTIHEPVAQLMVEKTGVDAGADTGTPCTDRFQRYYSVDQRVLDHLRAIEYLRKHASWWNGQIYLYGWSEGAEVGAQLAAYVPEVRRAVLGGLGGGLSMAQQLEDYMLCATPDAKDRDACLMSLRGQFDQMRDNPTPLKTWLGDDNSYKAWATRLDGVTYHVLKDLRIPLLVVHGAKDHDSVPVEAARVLMDRLKSDGNATVDYWEVPEMGHSFGSLAPERSTQVLAATFRWLFRRDPGPGGPPRFGLP